MDEILSRGGLVSNWNSGQAGDHGSNLPTEVIALVSEPTLTDYLNLQISLNHIGSN